MSANRGHQRALDDDARKRAFWIAAPLVMAAVCAVLFLLPAAPADSAAQRAIPRGNGPTVVSPVPAPAKTTPQRRTTATRPQTPPRVGDIEGARRSARRFLRSYLPVLYGRRPPSTVRAANARVRAALQDAAPSRPAGAERRPRVTAFVARTQGTARVLVLATAADGVSRPFQIVFAVTREQQGTWLVSELANY